jgi:hypothetical protein
VVKPDRPDREARLVLRVLLERLDLKASAGPVGLRDPLVIRAKPDLQDLRDLLELPARRVSKGPRDLQDLLVRRVSPDLQDLRDRQGLPDLRGQPDPLDLLGQRDQPEVLRHLLRDRRSSLPQFASD